jgi:uncharacterized membrane protein
MKKLLSWAIWLIMLVPAIYLAMVWDRIPEQVAMHFDIEGTPDRYGSKREFLVMTLVLVAVSALSYLLLTNIYRIDPKRYAPENKDRLKKMGFGLVIFLAALQCMFIYNSSHGITSFGLIIPAMGLLFAFLGNYMQHIKPNYFAGFRLPWTLESEDNWKKTHKLVGKLWFAGGLLIAVVSLFLHQKAAFIFFITVMSIITVIPIIYSYRLYVEQKKASKTIL